MKRHGFTLIELLVVLAILGLLAALLFPVFAGVRERARQTACLSNLRQIAMAVQAYAQENNEYIPPYNSSFYGTLSAVGPPMTDHGADLVSCLNPYTHSRAIWFCPADIYARTPSTAGSVNHLYLSYATSLAWFDRRWALGNTRIDFRTPSSDAAPSHGLVLLSDDPWDFLAYSGQVPPPYSHRGHFMYVMFDGHVKGF